jgi:hypothetical protein
MTPTRLEPVGHYQEHRDDPDRVVITGRVTKVLARKRLATGIGVQLRRSHAFCGGGCRESAIIRSIGPPRFARSGLPRTGCLR